MFNLYDFIFLVVSFSHSLEFIFSFGLLFSNIFFLYMIKYQDVPIGSKESYDV